jgi:hypothetical protein
MNEEKRAAENPINKPPHVVPPMGSTSVPLSSSLPTTAGLRVHIAGPGSWCLMRKQFECRLLFAGLERKTKLEINW